MSDEIQNQDEQCDNLPLQVESPLPVDVDGALEWWDDYQRLTKELLTDDDYQDGEFKKKSAWRKYGTAFQITVKKVSKDILRDDQGRVITAEWEVEAIAPNGRSIPGYGACSIWDKSHELDKVDKNERVTCKGPCNGRKHFDKPEHDIPSTAFTRAFNRAISDMIGAGEVSAEEMSLTTTKTVKKGNGRTGKVKARQRPGTGNLKQEMASKKTPSKLNDEDAVNDIINNAVDADFKEKKKPSPTKQTKTTDEPETVNMASVDLTKIKGINQELDKWIHTVEDVGANKDEVIEACQDLLGEDKITQDEVGKVKEALGGD